MKKHIARVVTAIFIMAAFAGIVSACAVSENAVEMQDMLDRLKKDFSRPATQTASRVQAFQWDEDRDKDLKKYDPLLLTDENGNPMKLKNPNQQTPPKFPDDYTADTTAARLKDTFGARLDAIDDFYWSLTVAERKESGMSRARKELEDFNDRVNDYRAVDEAVVRIQQYLETLTFWDEKPEAGTYLELRNRYDKLTKSQKDLYESCGSAHQQARIDAYKQLEAWQKEINAARDKAGLAPI